MIRLGLRLTLRGGKEAAVRLAIAAAAVALGVGLLFIALAGMNALTAQNARTAWLNTGGRSPGPGPGVAGPPGGPTISQGAPDGANPSSSDPLWWVFNEDHFGNQTIDRVDVAATGPDSPVPPGIAHLPGPGQFYASPALSRLLRSTPADELGDRFGGQQIGTIGPAALPSPNSLIIVIGHTAQQLSSIPGAGQVTAINTDSHLDGSNGWDANKLQTILAIGALALLFPVLIFIGTATRLSAARREQRFAAMRLVGATPRQVSVISAVEASVAALGGVVGGFGVFFLLRPVLTNLPFTGAPFAPGDLSLGLVDLLLVVVGVPLAAVAAARIAMRRVQISPLGVTRRVTPSAPRAYRLVPLLAGVAELAYFVEVGRPKSTGGQIEAYFSGCLLMMAGLVIAGPWLTMVGSRCIVGRTSRPAVLIAGRRLSDNPRGAFRSISGLIIALFATSVSVGIITTILADNGTSVTGTAASATLIDQVGFSFGPNLSLGGQEVGSPSVPNALIRNLRSIPHVGGVTLLYSSSGESPNGAEGNGGEGNNTVLASCDQLSRTPALGRCAPGAVVATITGNLDRPVTGKSTLSHTVWPAATISLPSLQGLPLQAIVVGTSGSHTAIERARTALEIAYPDLSAPSTLSEINANSTRSVTELQQLTKVVILVSLVIAGCSLAVSVTAGVNDRKRPFSLLRLTGVPLRALRRVVALEAAVPLLVIAVPSIGMGFLAAGLFLRSQLGESLRPPGIEYYVIVVAGLAASLAIIASTLPLIDRITGPEIARNE
jgi:hypothetical protein